MTSLQPVLVNPTRGTVNVGDAWSSAPHFMKLMGGNTGNLAFMEAALQTIEGLERRTTRPLGEASSFVWACANFLASHRSIPAPTGPIFDLQKPIIAIGLGAQAESNNQIIDVPDQSRDWVHAVANRAASDAPNISVRGEYSKRVLESLGVGHQAVALGCPSLFLSPSPHLGADIAAALDQEDQPKVYGVCPGNIRHAQGAHAELERLLWKLTTETGADYLIQHPVDIVALASNLEHDLTDSQVRRIAEMVAPNSPTTDYLGELRQRARIFPEVASWIFGLRRLDLVASARFHGTQLALQAGTPALCITIDQRQREMCDIMHVPSIDYTESESMSWDVIAQRLREHDWDAFDVNRRDLARRFRDFLSGNGLQASQHLTTIGDYSAVAPGGR